jgi:hypothetical protein
MTETTIATFLETLPGPAELNKRAELTAAISSQIDSMYSFDELYTATDEVTIAHWDDGGGQTLQMFFVGNDALVLVYDHEVSTNFYGEEDKAPQQEALYEGVPENLLRFATNQEENYWGLNIKLPNGNDVYAASLVLWYTDGAWHYGEKFDELTSNDEDGGLKYCLDHLIPEKEDITADDVKHVWEEAGYDEFEHQNIIDKEYDKIYNA